MTGVYLTEKEGDGRMRTSLTLFIAQSRTHQSITKKVEERQVH